jgi:hypothetical protein
MNYLKIYINLIKKAKNQPEPKVHEKHHVFPKSIYGNNKYIVKLTPRQHYIAHALLYKGLKKRYGSKDKKTKKMLYAFWFMHAKGPKHNRDYINSKTYETLKIEFVKALKTEQFGKNNPFFGKKHTVLSRRKNSLNNGGNGQVEGLFEYFDKKFNKILSKPLVNIEKKNPINLDLTLVLHGLMGRPPIRIEKKEPTNLDLDYVLRSLKGLIV